MDWLDRKALEMMGREPTEDSPCPNCKKYSLLSDRYGDVVVVHCVICDYSAEFTEDN